MLLGDVGASILKIERPPKKCGSECETRGSRLWAARRGGGVGGGDDSRRFGPPFLPHSKEHLTGNVEDERLSTYYLSVNRNKRSFALDLSNEKGRDIARTLAKNWADVVVENFKPGTMKKMGLDYDDLKDANPGLVYCSISGYGPSGPWSSLPGYDVVIAGTHGLMSITGSPEAPAKVGVAMTDIVTGTFAHGAILTALYDRAAHPEKLGQRVDLSLMESQLACLSTTAAGALNAVPGTPPPGRRGTAHENIAPYQAFKCKDGEYFVIGTGNDQQFSKLCETLGTPELAADERFLTNASRVTHRDELIALLEDAFSMKDRDTWFDLFRGHGFPCGPVRNVQEAFDCEQAQYRKMTLEVDHSVAGHIRVPAHPAKYSRSPIADGTFATLLPPPMLGEHTEDTLVNLLGMSTTDVNNLEDEGIVSCWRGSSIVDVAQRAA
jgi:crotonobetainyl-CoA:carnitine CoA-transferase CaiB-like acyl-CoA transferase